ISHPPVSDVIVSASLLQPSVVKADAASGAVAAGFIDRLAPGIERRQRHAMRVAFLELQRAGVITIVAIIAVMRDGAELRERPEVLALAPHAVKIGEAERDVERDRI